MNISKSFVQLPMLFFFMLATLADARRLTSDRINTYKFTPEGGNSSTLFIMESSKDGAHILLSEFRSDAGRQEACQHEAASAAINRRRGVTRLIPDVNHPGISDSHRVIYHPPSSEEIPISPLDPDMRVHEKHHKLKGVTIPSVSVLKGLSSSPVEGENRVILALPLPARIPVQLPVQPEHLWLVHGSIRQPVVEARDDSTFIVSGNSLVGRMNPHAPPGSRNRELIVSGAVPVVAVFTYSSADDSIRLREFTAPNFMAITHTGSRETSEHGEDMDSFWLQLERYQEQQLRKAKQQEFRKSMQQEYINGAGAESSMPESAVPDKSRKAHESRKRPSDDVLQPRKVAKTGFSTFSENSAMPEGDDAGTESSVPEGDNASMEIEPGTADNGILSNAPENPPIELLMDDQPLLPLGLQSNSK